MSWNEAARFTNWLNTSQGFPAAYKFSAQPGEPGYNPNENILLWEAGEPGFDPANLFRNRRTRYVLPSAHEWYKAAYYDPAANGGTGGYRGYPTGSDTAPTAVASGTDAGTAVYSQPYAQGPADITQAGGLSPYGVMGLGGNVWEWEETEFDLTNDHRNDAISFGIGVRGGGWVNHFGDAAGKLSASYHDSTDPTLDFYFIGFRVASIPEPTSLLLGVLACTALLRRSRLS